MSIVIHIRIPDSDVWAEFQAYVARKYKKIKGALGREVCKALKFYLESVSKTDARTHIETRSSKVENQGSEEKHSRTMNNIRKIASKLINEYPNEVSEREIERVILETAGGDMRTLRKYKILLENYGIIQPDRMIRGTNPPKFIFKVNGVEAIRFR